MTTPDLQARMFGLKFSEASPGRIQRAQPNRSQSQSPETSRNLNRGTQRTTVEQSGHIAEDFSSTQDGNRHYEDSEEEEEDPSGDIDDYEVESYTGDEDDDRHGEAQPLLPIFSATHLDAIPVFAMTHAIRTLVSTRCDTVLTWEQLRAPQISQFLVKPIEQEIRKSHLNAATQYALMSNCLQYGKEAALSSGNSGTNATRAMVCELLAIKMLREYSTRALIDALAYDFDPLQGQQDVMPEDQRDNAARKAAPRPARISCFEIAIRAQAKKFLSHPMVVKQLEAIWAGTIVFHSAADSLHRHPPSTKDTKTYGTSAAPTLWKAALNRTDHHQPMRRAVTLYNPREASLFKLSRLRVPRYRNFLSTLSFAILLSLFVAVLVERSLEITPLEILFWLWAAGYMLDEILGFNEQGFSLYIASFWNVFDLGILLVLLIHLALRLYGILMPDVRKHTVANMAYDVLAADAILLFPRLFSVLDHYRYFSPLLIAFRYMAVDLVAVSLLIVISCSGFFVALTLSFGNDGIDSPSSVAYALLQMVMGFTPAAWDRWGAYNWLGKTILTLFLFICHFLIVTILITVLTNSFMAIVRNAYEEHQFLFAVNTMSHVKSDALFSYVAPTNLLQWVLVPLRYMVPFRQYVKINRTVIKVTHLPILWSIFAYEKTVLHAAAYDSIDLVERRGPTKKTTRFSSRLIRAPSIATFRQDRALEEVFRQPFDNTLRSVQPNNEQRKASNVVNTWMNTMGDHEAEPPQEQDHSVLDRLEARRTTFHSRQPPRKIRDFSRRTMSALSDPEEFATNTEFLSPGMTQPRISSPSGRDDLLQQTDADGDDELHTIDDIAEEDGTTTQDLLSETDAGQQHRMESEMPVERDYFATKPSPKSYSALKTQSPASIPRSRIDNSGVDSTSPSKRSPKYRPHQHARNVSTATMIFKPVFDSGTEQSSSKGATTAGGPGPQISAPASGARTPLSKLSSQPGQRLPKRATGGQSKMRPVLPAKNEQAFRSTPNLAGMLSSNDSRRQHRRPSLELDIVSDIGDGKALAGGFVGALPSGFAAQMARPSHQARYVQEQNDQQERYVKIMMARMNTLEEGFREVVHEMRDYMHHDKAEGKRGRESKTVARYPKLRAQQSQPQSEDARSEQQPAPVTAVVAEIGPEPLVVGRGDEEVGGDKAQDQASMARLDTC
jgi:hypothetical protein